MNFSKDITCKTMSSFEGVVLDVDNTLVYAVEEGEDSEEEKDLSSLEHIHISVVKQRGYTSEIDVYLRPHVREFLSVICKQYKVALWSLGQPEYVAAIAKILDLGTATFNSTASNKCHFIYNWNHAHREQYKIYKPLRLSPFKDIKTLIIEDNINVCAEGDSYIIVPSFEGESNDLVCKGLLSSMCNLQAIPL